MLAGDSISRHRVQAGGAESEASTVRHYGLWGHEGLGGVHNGRQEHRSDQEGDGEERWD